jgi:hypothetical protein
MRAGIWCLGVAALAGCTSEVTTGPEDEAGKADDVTEIGSVVMPEQGWDGPTRSAMYHITQGSELMPLTWFMNLEDAELDALFVDRLGDFGILADPTSPAGLPVGFTQHVDEETASLYGDRRWVGVNCALCHTGQIKVRGRSIRIDGGASLIDFPAFQRALLAAARRTLDDPNRFALFAASVGVADDVALRQNLGKFVRRFGERLTRSDPEYVEAGQRVLSGPGRLDGLGAPVNETLCKLAELGDPILRALIEKPENCATAQPAASIPHIWGAPQQEFVQWGGNVHVSLGRNVGEVQGVYGTNWVESVLGVPVFRTSANFESSHAIETTLKDLRPPSWRAMATDGLLPPLDEDLVQRGAALFERECESCHATRPALTPPSEQGYRYWKVNVSDVGTDPRLLNRQNTRTAVLPTILTIPFSLAFGANAIGPGNVVNATNYRALVIVATIKEQFIADGLFGTRRADQLEDCRSPRDQALVGYKGRGLEGIAFTGPFLHNGSVPTIDDLLRPVAERPASFHVGCTDFDTARLGFACDARSARPFLFDTRLPNNSNRGHEYGTTLDEDDRAALLEFIKTIEQPANPPVPASGLCL